MAFTNIFKHFGVPLENEESFPKKSYFVAKNLNQMKLKDNFPTTEKKAKKVHEGQPSDEEE